MSDPQIRSELVGKAGLWVALGIATALTLSRPHVSPSPELRRRFLALFAGAIAAQGAHFAEELITGFYDRFPAVLGLAPWTSTFFVSFNLAWIAVWILSAFGLSRGMVAALVPAWFLGLASLLNGIAHPLLALREGGYFPGLYTSPLLLVLGVLLLRRLMPLTERTSPYTSHSLPRTPRS